MGFLARNQVQMSAETLSSSLLRRLVGLDLSGGGWLRFPVREYYALYTILVSMGRTVPRSGND